MAERPDLEYVVPILQERLRDRRIVSVTAPKPIVLRVAVRGDAASLLTGQVFARVQRRAHFVIFGFVDTTLEMVVAPMLAGRFLFVDKKLPRGTAVTWGLENGETLVYRDDVQMGKVYIIERGAWQVVPGLAQIGVDVLSKDFTLEAGASEVLARRIEVLVPGEADKLIRLQIAHKKTMHAFCS